MEGKLKKIGNEYKLYAQDDSCIATSWHSPYQRLSKKNCEAIKNGYDLDEIRKLADEDFECELGDGPTTNESINSMIKKSNANGAEWGFKKAVGILGDKKFSEDDLREAISQTRKGMLYNKQYEDEHIQSLQQTEWDVEIEMEQYVKYVPKSLETIYPTGGVRPKLDEDGCLILRRK